MVSKSLQISGLTWMLIIPQRRRPPSLVTALGVPVSRTSSNTCLPRIKEILSESRVNLILSFLWSFTISNDVCRVIRIDSCLNSLCFKFFLASSYLPYIHCYDLFPPLPFFRGPFHFWWCLAWWKGEWNNLPWYVDIQGISESFGPIDWTKLGFCERQLKSY